MKKTFIYGLLFFVLLLNCYAQLVDVPINLQIPIFYKIFQYEKNLKNSKNNTVNIGIVYQEKYRISLNYKNECEKFINADRSIKIGGKEVNLYKIDISDASDLEYYNKKNKLDVIIITPLRSIDLQEISGTCKDNKIISFSLVPDYFYDYGFAITLENIGDKTQIDINLKSAKQEGADFSSKLLKLAKVIN